MNRSISQYLEGCSLAELDPSTLMYVANLSSVASVFPEVARGIVKELGDQRTNLKLIASENYCSLATQAAMGNLLTDKYAEGVPGHRFYSGCDNIDEIESLACEEAKLLFGAEHAYVQPHSGADANLIAYWAILHTRVAPQVMETLMKVRGESEIPKINDLNKEEWQQFRKALGNQRLLALDYYSGGHLTHGYRFNVSAQMFDCYSYGVDSETGLLDYEAIEQQAKEIKPLILLAGYSAYPGLVDFKRMRQIADQVGAVLMVDMAHFCGLVAGKVFSGDYDPVKHAHLVTSTTHKTLRGPRGGIVLCKEEFAEQVDKGCPLVIGGPLPHVMAAKAVAFREANSKQFQDYAQQIVENSKALAASCVSQGMEVATGGTENHLLLIDVRSFGLNGRQAESVLRECGITLNRNSLPNDPNGAWFTSGLRVGTPAATTLGMGKLEMDEIAAVFKLVLSNSKPGTTRSGATSRARAVITDEGVRREARGRISGLLERFPVYPELDLSLLEKLFGCTSSPAW